MQRAILGTLYKVSDKSFAMISTSFTSSILKGISTCVYNRFVVIFKCPRECCWCWITVNFARTNFWFENYYFQWLIAFLLCRNDQFYNFMVGLKCLWQEGSKNLTLVCKICVCVQYLVDGAHVHMLWCIVTSSALSFLRASTRLLFWVFIVLVI